MSAKLIAHVYLALTIVLSVYSQLMIKWRVSGHFVGLKVPEGLGPKIMTLLSVIFDPFILSGLVATFVSGLCWMATMSKLQISYAYPFTSIGFALVMILSYFFFGEPMNAWKIAGVILIMAGIAVASQG